MLARKHEVFPSLVQAGAEPRTHEAVPAKPFQSLLASRKPAAWTVAPRFHAACSRLKRSSVFQTLRSHYAVASAADYTYTAGQNKCLLLAVAKNADEADSRVTSCELEITWRYSLCFHVGVGGAGVNRV